MSRLKFKQIEYVLAVARTGSFSKAAKELYISQPNISSAVNSLEEELGFQVFQRTNQGINLTKEGTVFLKHAHNIIEEYNKIGVITEREHYHKFSIESMFNHTLVSQAFSNLCYEYQDSRNLDFSLYSGTSSEIFENVYMGKAQLGILLVNQMTLDRYINSTSKKGIYFETIQKMRMNVNIRIGHPLLQKEDFDLSELHNYPFVNYHFNFISDFPDIFSLGIIDPDKIINVSEIEIRGQIVISTNAFSIGCGFHPKSKRVDEMVSIPLSIDEVFLVLIYQEAQLYNEELQRFTQLLKEELSKIKLTYS